LFLFAAAAAAVTPEECVADDIALLQTASKINSDVFVHQSATTQGEESEAVEKVRQAGGCLMCMLNYTGPEPVAPVPTGLCGAAGAECTTAAVFTETSDEDQAMLQLVQEAKGPASPEKTPARTRFTLHVLAWNRESSLQRLLTSLEHAHYDGDRVDLAIHLDGGFSDGALRIAEQQAWAFGEKRIMKASQNGGLARSWFTAWQPTSDADRALILEDDVEVSPLFYRWLKAAWHAYSPPSGISEVPDLGGISLQRQTLVPQGPHKRMVIENGFEPYLYKLVGSIGYSPHPARWREFTAWVNSVDFEKVDVSVPGLVTTSWWHWFKRRSMWTQHWIWWCNKDKLFTLYASLRGKKTLAAHWREKGEHHTNVGTRDFLLATETSEVPLGNFPAVLNRYGWDAKPVPSAETPSPAGVPPAQRPSEPMVPAPAIPSRTVPQTEYEKRDYVGLREAARKLQVKHGFVVLQLLNRGYVTMTKNWVCNVLQKLPANNILAKTLFVTTDAESFEAMRSFSGRDGALALHVYKEEWASAKNLNYGQVAYYQMMLFRTRMLVRLLQDGVTVWLTEADAVWLGDPEPYVVTQTAGQEAADIVTMSDRNQPGKFLNGGFQFLRPTAKTLEVWQSVEKRLEKAVRSWKATEDTRARGVGNAGSEQLMLNEQISKTPGLHVAWVDPELFVSGLWYKTDVHGKSRGPAGFGKRMPLVILNNWIVGNGAKIARAKANHHWYLTDDERTCAAGA